MPRVPTLNDQAPGPVQSRAFAGRQSISTDADMFGATGARQLDTGAKVITQFNEVANKVFIKEQAAADTTALLEAEELTDAELRKIQWGDKGFFKRQGKDAQNSTSDVGYLWEKHAKAQIKKYRSNPRLTSRLHQYLGAQKRKLMSAAARHEQAEMEKYQTGLFTSKIERAARSAVEENYNAWLSQSRVREEGAGRGSLRNRDSEYYEYYAKRSWKEGLESIEKNGNRLGRDRAEIDLEKEKYVDRIISGVVDKMLANGKDKSASHFYETNKHEIKNEEIKTRLEKALADGSRLGEAHRIVDNIFNKYTGLTYKDGTERLKKAREAAAKANDPKMREVIIKLATRRNKEIENAEKSRDTELYRDAATLIGRKNTADSGLNNIAIGKVIAFEDLPASMLPRNPRLVSSLKNQQPGYDAGLHQEALNMRRDYLQGKRNGWTSEVGAAFVRNLEGRLPDQLVKGFVRLQQKDGSADPYSAAHAKRLTADLSLATKYVKATVIDKFPITEKPGSDKNKKQRMEQKQLLASVQADIMEKINGWYEDKENRGKTLTRAMLDSWIFESLTPGREITNPNDPKFSLTSPGSWFGDNRKLGSKTTRIDFLKQDKKDKKGGFQVDPTPEAYETAARSFGISGEALVMMGSYFVLPTSSKGLGKKYNPTYKDLELMLGVFMRDYVGRTSDEGEYDENDISEIFNEETMGSEDWENLDRHIKRILIPMLRPQ